MAFLDTTKKGGDNTGEADSLENGENNQVLAPEEIQKALRDGKRVDPHRIEEEERMGGRVPIGASLKLSYQHLNDELDGYHLTWQPGHKVETFLQAGYQPVIEGEGIVGDDRHEVGQMDSWVSRPSGKSRVYLLAIKEELREQDIAATQKISDEIDEAIQGGMLDQRDQGDSGKRGLNANVSVTRD